MLIHRITTLLLVTLLATSWACTTSTPQENGESSAPTTEPTEASADDEFQELLAAADEAFAERHDEARLREALDLWATATDHPALADDPGRRAELHATLARGHYFWGRYHHSIQPDADPAVISEIAEAGVHHARTALRHWSPQVVSRLAHEDPWDVDYSVVPPEGIDALLGYARTTTLWSQVQEPTEQLASEPLIDAIMAHVIEVQPDAHGGAALRYYGTRHLTRHFNRDHDASEEAFQRAIDAAPDFAINRLLRARDLATHRGDRDLFEADLRAVIDADPEHPDYGPENAFAAELAQRILDRADELFAEP